MDDVEHTLFSALVGLASADGRIAPEEAAWLQHVMQAAGVGLEDAGRPLDRPNLKRILPDHGDRIRLLQFGLMVAMADGEVSAPELEYLQGLARDLGVSEAEVEEIRQRTVLAVHPEGQVDLSAP